MDLFLTNSSLVQATHNPKVGIALNHSANAVILPPPAALRPLEPLAGHYMLLISQSKSRPRGRYTIPNLAPLPLVTLVTRLDHAAETPEGYTTL